MGTTLLDLERETVRLVLSSSELEFVLVTVIENRGAGVKEGGENMFWRNEGGDYATIYRGAKYCAAGIGGNGAKGGGYSVQ